MAMTVLNNTSAMMTLGELNKNINRVGKDLKKVSTGTKITSAQDDASGYAISERMRVMMRSLGQDEQNVKNGRFLLHVAAGGIDNIVEELRNLKKLALNAANDHNTDADRATIQKEFDQKMANINDIASETNYNGKILLDGRYGQVADASSAQSASLVDSSNVSTVIDSSNYWIQEDGVYMLPQNYTGRVSISENAKNVKIQQENQDIALRDVSIIGPQSGGVNLYLENLNIQNRAEYPDWGRIIQFQGAQNFLSIDGDVHLEITKDDDGYVGRAEYAVINCGDGLTISGGGMLSIKKVCEGNASYYSRGAVIGSDENGICGDIVINNVSINIHNDIATGDEGAQIGSGYRGSCGNITISAGANVDISGSGISGIGSGQYGRCGDIFIDSCVKVADRSENNYVGDSAGIGAGYDGTCGTIEICSHADVTVFSIGGAGIGSGRDWDASSSCDDIIVFSGAKINAQSVDGAGIGSGSASRNGSRCGDITIYSGAEIVVSSRSGAGIGTGGGGTCGDINVYSNVLMTASSERGDNIGKGIDSPWIESITGEIRLNEGELYANKYIAPIDYANVFEQDMKCNVVGKSPLVIHHGPKANQALNVYINDMRTDAMGLSGTKVTTREAAIQALSDDSTDPPRIGAIDAAIEYALNEATNVGAYISRLGYTEENIVTANENTQASESTIRDADMAQEMMSYAKDNVLAQAAQSMLAQANQNASSVLSLLQ